MEIKPLKYSVIIPHYNDEVGLLRLLESIPRRDDIQVIVVDDKSDSNIFQFIEAHDCSDYLEVFLNDRQKSAGSCRNIGLDEALGEYLIFADSDDIFVQGAFDAIDEKVASEREADILFFNVTSQNESGGEAIRHLKNRNLVLNFLYKRGVNYESKLRLTHNVPWGKVFKREFIENNGIRFDNTIIANDGIFSLKAGKLANSISASEDIIYSVMQREGSLTKIKDKNKFRVRCEVYCRYFHMLTPTERREVNASPLPLIYMSLDYGIWELVKSIVFFKKNKVSILRYFKLDRRKIIELFAR